VDLREQLQDHLGDAFTIERELGGGGMSRVFVATEVRLNRRVAIKVLSPELAQGLNAERFEREILLAASLQQANIVPVLAAGEVGGLPYFTMPFISGDALRALIAEGPLPIAEATAVLRDVAKALAYAHAAGIVHRDIKPDNVLLSGGTAMVTDFGIAKAISAASQRGDTAEPGATLTQVGTSIGTPPYMAPEQVAGDPSVDHRVDLYALGCVAFELLTGQTPFGDRPAQRMLAAHLSEAPASVASSRPECPPALAALVADLLAKEPADRPGSATEVVRRLDEVGTGSAPNPILSGPGATTRILVLYAVATVVVALVAKAAVVGIGLPDWTLTGAVGLMLLGLPPLLFTAFAKHTSRRAARATPTMTPGGTMSARPPGGTMTAIALKAAPHLSWRRWLRGGMAAMAGFVLLVAGFMVTRSMGIGPAASLFASGSLASQDRLLLADFVMGPEDSALAPIVQEAVRTAMSQSTAVRLLGSSDVATALGRMQRPPDTPLDASVAQEVAQRAGAKAILGGRLARAGGGDYVLSVELTDAASGDVLASAQGSGDLLTTIDKATKALRGKIGESLRQVQQTVPLAQATTPSLEALRKFTEAKQANDQDRDFDLAVSRAREAVAIDSTFALAWRKLAVALENTQAPRTETDAAIEKAFRYSDRLPPTERLLIRGRYFESHSSGYDRARAIEAYREALAIDSTEWVALNQLGILFSNRGAHDSALVYARRQWEGDPADQVSGIAYASALALAGQSDAARSFVADSLGALTGAGPQLFSIGLRYQLGEQASLPLALDSLAVTPFVPIRVRILMTSSQLLATLGRTDDAIAAMTQAAETLDARGLSGEFGFVGRSFLEAIYGDKAAAVAGLRVRLDGPQWQGTAQELGIYLAAVGALTEAGAIGEAKALLARAKAAWPEAAESGPDRDFLEVVEGQIALAEGDAETALEWFREGTLGVDGYPSASESQALFGVARSFEAIGQPDSAIAAFERYLALPPMRRLFQSGDRLYLASVRKRLGDLHDAKGNTALAMKYYGDFVEQWKDADPELQPVVRQVRARMAELQRQEAP
jgi:tetratricopeptide (TPR) repeat protein/tRNA A-37 threonylcarbamoyl transferase component Bud32